MRRPSRYRRSSGFRRYLTMRGQYLGWHMPASRRRSQCQEQALPVNVYAHGDVTLVPVYSTYTPLKAHMSTLVSNFDITIPNRLLIDRYELKTVIGSGGMGTVYSSWDHVLKRRVAVKLLSFRASQNMEQVQWIQREARVLARLDHPNILKVLDFGITDRNHPFLVTELVDGDSLEHILKYKGPIAVSQSIDIAIQICEGLKHAHAHNILHRDMKPSNVLVNADCSAVRIIDLGQAKLGEQRITKTGIIVGSPLYMSPEQANGADMDERSDIYSMGCLLFAMLTGEPPFLGDTKFATMSLHMRAERPSLGERAPDVDFPYGLEYIIHKCLGINADERFASIEDLQSALFDLKWSTEHPDDGLIETALNPSQNRKLSKIGSASIVAFCSILMTVLMYLTTFISVEQAKDKPSALDPDFTLTSINLEGFVGDFKSPDEASEITVGRSDSKAVVYKSKTPLDDVDIKKFINQGAMEELILDGSHITGSGLTAMSGFKVKNLRMRQTSLDDAGARSIANFKNLTALDVRDCESLTDAGMSQFKSLRQLKVLSFGSKNTTIDTFRIVADMPSIECVFIDFDKFKMPAGFGKKLARAPKLIGVSFACKNVDPACVEELASIPQLTQIALIKSRVTRSATRALAKLPNVQLHLYHCTSFEPGAILELSGKKRLSVCTSMGETSELPLDEIRQLRKLRRDADIRVVTTQ